MTDEERALNACRRYVETQTAIKTATRNISGSLALCTLHHVYTDTGETHLSNLYASRSAGYSDSAIELCIHCQKADALIQDRKKLRYTLGGIKRTFTTLGRRK